MVATASCGVITVAKLGGAAFLIGYGLLAAKRSLRPSALTPADAAPARLAGVLTTCLALTFLNPHVYLDTVVMLGTIANQHEPRWVFAGGAMLGSLVWFAGLGWGAHLLAPVLRSPRVWRAIDLGIAAVMLLVAAKLAFAF